MLSDTGITISGHTFTSLQFLGVGALLLGIAALLLGYSRERRTTLKRSIVTDELSIHLGRIADALDRIASQRSDRVADRASYRANWREPLPKAEALPSADAAADANSEWHGVSYSMFGR